MTVHNGEVCKFLTSKGLEERTREQGTYNMPFVLIGAQPKAVKLEVHKDTQEFSINSLFLPESNVDLRNVEVGIQFQVREAEESRNTAFQEVRAEPIATQEGDSNRILLISTERLWEIYLERKAPDAIVSTLRTHTVDEVLVNVPEIADACRESLNAVLADTPLQVTEVGFPNGIGEAPEEVLAAKRRLYAIEEEKAREIKALEAALAIEDQRQSVQRIRVENDSINAKSASTDYTTYTFLKIFDRFADAAEAGTPVALGGQFIPITPEAQIPDSEDATTATEVEVTNTTQEEE